MSDNDPRVQRIGEKLEGELVRRGGEHGAVIGLNFGIISDALWEAVDALPFDAPDEQVVAEALELYDSKP